jgi:hypothetical protein
VKFHTRLKSKDFVVVLVVVLVLVLDTVSRNFFTNFLILEHEDEYEKNKIKLHVYALGPQPYTM